MSHAPSVESLYHWNVPVALSDEEEAICKRLQRTGKLFVFLRRQRAQLFDEAFERELSAMYAAYPRGKAPVPPALLAMVTLLQAYEQTSDARAVEDAVFDRRWQMVLGCLGASTAPFSQGVLVDFRRRLIEAELDQRLLARTVELAQQTGEFGYKQLRVALDSAPLWGAGRVEDTFNLLGHALEILLRCVVEVSGRSQAQLMTEAGLTVLGGSSLKAQLDIDWDDADAQQRALTRLITEIGQLRAWLVQHLPDGEKTPPIREAVALLEQLLTQDVEPDPDGGGYRVKRGTARNRRISIGDADMRHGRKSRSRVINGYKRHVARELEHGLILAATVRPANEPEHQAAVALQPTVEAYGEVVALHIDRGYLASDWTRELHQQGQAIVGKPWSTRQANGRMGKEQFLIDLAGQQVNCPGGQSASIRHGNARFPAAACVRCPLQAQCTTSKQGRSISIHPQEALMQELRSRQQTTAGRQALRERTAVEHALAHVCRRQGPRARYLGVRKNEFDLRRTAAIVNLHTACRLQRAA